MGLPPLPLRSGAMDAFLVIAALIAINLAAIVLLDLLTGPGSWGRKAGWAVLVIGLPLLGPLLCYRRGPAAARRERRRVTGMAPGTNEAAGAETEPRAEPGPDVIAPAPLSELGSLNDAP
jgi:hypothetical protein